MSSFLVSLGDDDPDRTSGSWTFWGRGDASGFSGARGEQLSTTGEVFTGHLGADHRWGTGLRAGIWSSRVVGDIGYRDDADEGTLRTSLVNLHPYVVWSPRTRLALWSVLGFGRGEVSLEEGVGASAFTSGLGMTMAAAGGRLSLASIGATDLDATADAFHVGMASDAGEDLPAVEAVAQRLRFGIESGRRFRLGGGAVLTPSVEIGVRRDAGDAETGAGFDLGGGVLFTHPERGLRLDLSARRLIAHQAEGFREWGISGSFGYDSDPSSERGLSLTLRNGYGAAAGGARGLLDRPTLPGLAAADEAGRGGSFDAELGYGLPVFGGRYTGRPRVRFGQRNGARDWRFGWEFQPSRRYARGLDFGFSVTRRERGGPTPGQVFGFEAIARWRGGAPWR